jgi:diaminopimelate epimerase
MTGVRGWSFAKGHGTENDFVVVVDRENMQPTSPAQVRHICDRRCGIGGDGLLRAVLAKHIPAWDGDDSLWFMDYSNADGSVAEMCGNGIRLFARFLVEEGLAYGPVVPIATRAGLREVELLSDGRFRVAMGPVVVTPEPVKIVTTDGTVHSAVPVDVGNPHAVSFVDDVRTVALQSAPEYPADAFPEGVNAEFVQELGKRHLAMRVYERGSGETRSCGTGTVAVAAAAHARAELAAVLGAPEDPVVYRVDVPGGIVEVELGEQAHLTGPAVVVARGVMRIPEEA